MCNHQPCNDCDWNHLCAGMHDIKTSSQISVIGIAELMYAADTIRGISFKPMEPLIIVALIYFVITFTISLILKRIEKYMRKSSR